MPWYMSRLLQSLSAITAANPFVRKRLVGIDVNYGRELLQSLARQTGGWIGWEAVTVGRLAGDLAFVPLSGRGERIASDIETAALVNAALDGAIEAGQITGRFAELARGLGFRGALRDALLDARTGGVTVNSLQDVAAADPSASALAVVLERYEALLVERKLADPAAVLRCALVAFDAEAPFLLDGVIALVPSLTMRGLAGDLLTRLRELGAVILDADMPRGITAPPSLLAGRQKPPADASSASSALHTCSLLALVSGSAVPEITSHPVDASFVTADIFVAATPAEELREVCRRAMAEGLRWDDVEIASTDPDSYGIALDALCGRLGVGTTMLKGVPLARTRLGRALDRWFAWIGDGLPADVLRQALEAGEIGLEGSGYPSSRLAGELRAFNIGWGRARYEAAIAQVESGHSTASMSPRDGDDDDFEERRARRIAVHGAVATLLRTLLASLPAVPERGNDRPVRTSVDALAGATLAYLALVHSHGQAERHTMERLQGRLEELARVSTADTSFGSALAALREALGDLRAWPMVTEERKPWSSAGGMLHLTSVQHAGTSGRKRIFVVGLDADRTRGGMLPDPVLSDDVRGRLGDGRLVTSGERREAGAWRTGAALAALRGRVTLSYAIDAADGGVAGPAPLLLQAWRLIHDTPACSFEEMQHALLPPACAVPRDHAGAVPLDARDVWLSALVDGALVLDGNVQTREAFASLAAGLDAMEIASGTELTGYHGHVPAAGPALNPLAQPDREISPSALEKLSACPLAWFYKYGLSLKDPQDAEYDATRWLDALQRGSLLHGVYERFVGDYLDRQDAIDDESAVAHVRALVDRAIDKYRVLVPPPSEMVYATEAAALRSDARAFLEMERVQRRSAPDDRWQSVELAFGTQFDGTPPAAPGTFALGDGHELKVRGRVDRIDTLADGSLRVVDYKTGSHKHYQPSRSGGAFAGGRHLQPSLYAEAVQSITGTSVGIFEYRFPTEKGESETVSYGAAELSAARAVVRELLGLVQAGHFIATDDSGDCSYCDYRAICRAHRGDFKTDSPRASWSAGCGLPAGPHAAMRGRRGNAVSTTTITTTTPDGAATAGVGSPEDA